ncbi:unnamed protein product, partial [Linum tenue]
MNFQMISAEDVDQFKDVRSPFIEHVIVSEKFLTSCNKKKFFLDIIFYCCRPKFLSVTPRIYKGSREKMLSAAEVRKRCNRLLRCNSFIYVL